MHLYTVDRLKKKKDFFVACIFFIVYIIVKMLCILMEVNEQHLQITALPEVDIC